MPEHQKAAGLLLIVVSLAAFGDRLVTCRRPAAPPPPHSPVSDSPAAAGVLHLAQLLCGPRGQRLGARRLRPPALCQHLMDRLVIHQRQYSVTERRQQVTAGDRQRGRSGHQPGHQVQHEP